MKINLVVATAAATAVVVATAAAIVVVITARIIVVIANITVTIISVVDVIIIFTIIAIICVVTYFISIGISRTKNRSSIAGSIYNNVARSIAICIGFSRRLKSIIVATSSCVASDRM